MINVTVNEETKQRAKKLLKTLGKVLASTAMVFVGAYGAINLYNNTHEIVIRDEGNVAPEANA